MKKDKEDLPIIKSTNQFIAEELVEIKKNTSSSFSNPTFTITVIILFLSISQFCLQLSQYDSKKHKQLEYLPKEKQEEAKPLDLEHSESQIEKDSLSCT